MVRDEPQCSIRRHAAAIRAARSGKLPTCTAPLLAAATLVLSGLAVASGAQADALDSLVGFQSRSKNIGCTLTTNGARCDIRERDWSPPRKPSSCELDYGQGLTISRNGSRGRFVFAGDTALGSGKALAYGRSLKRGGITCTSRESEITCKNAHGHGFRISRASYHVF